MLLVQSIIRYGRRHLSSVDCGEIENSIGESHFEVVGSYRALCIFDYAPVAFELSLKLPTAPSYACRFGIAFVIRR